MGHRLGRRSDERRPPALVGRIALMAAMLLVILAFLGHHGVVRPDVFAPHAAGLGRLSTAMGTDGEPTRTTPHHAADVAVCGTETAMCLSAKSDIAFPPPGRLTFAELLTPPGRERPLVPPPMCAPPPTPDLAELSVLRI
ncbi:hypothetical protein [Marinactinospora rubrisoli]|uniref:Uncharacterized protein n=1 Tax=Marinactinospora rubrisoli TaxID=2715399 RepID=A0ABW2KI61_9ACTN